MDLRQLNHRNHINDQCTECKEPEMFNRCYWMSTSHLSFRGDSEYFLQLYVRLCNIIKWYIAQKYHLGKKKYWNLKILESCCEQFSYCWFNLKLDYALFLSILQILETILGT